MATRSSPKSVLRVKAGSGHFRRRRSFAGVSHRSLEPGLEPGKGDPCPPSTTSTSSCCLARACDPAGVRSTPRRRPAATACRVRSSTGSRPPWRPPGTARRRSSSPCSSARFWSAPARLGPPFPIDRRALCGHPRAGADARPGFAARSRPLRRSASSSARSPEPGRRYQRTVDGLHRRPLAFRFGADFRSLFEAANKRPRRGPQKPQDGRRPLPAPSAARRALAAVLGASPRTSALTRPNNLPESYPCGCGRRSKKAFENELAPCGTVSRFGEWRRP